MRNVPLSVAFDLAKGDISTPYSNGLLSRSNTFASSSTHPSSGQLLKLRGAKGILARPPSRPERGADFKLRTAATSLTATSVSDRCSTPITELYQAIGKICGDVSDELVLEHEFASHPGGSEAPSPSPLVAAPSTAHGEWEQTVIYETGPKPRPVDAIPAPHRLDGRGVAPLRTRRRVANSGGTRLGATAPPRLVQSVAPQARRGDELVFLCRIPAPTLTPSQRNQPDPRSPLERPRAALPTHTCCSLARRDIERQANA
uniref:Glycogen debranching enzymye n=1 Tax=Ganoderma boninense TaxID=34458 RepID=A0A5K1K333_9APHY|nr:Glycogen debranching enzymye [Ganoderma boninense]